jgi:hypothetical protein
LLRVLELAALLFERTYRDYIRFGSLSTDYFLFSSALLCSAKFERSDQNAHGILAGNLPWRGFPLALQWIVRFEGIPSTTGF